MTLDRLPPQPDSTLTNGEHMPPFVSMNLDGRTATPGNLQSLIEGISNSSNPHTSRIRSILEAGRRVFLGSVAGKIAAVIETRPREIDLKPSKKAVIVAAGAAGVAIGTAGLIELILVSRKRASSLAKKQESSQ